MLIRRRYVLIFVIIFLSIYLIINYAILSDDLVNKIPRDQKNKSLSKIVSKFMGNDVKQHVQEERQQQMKQKTEKNRTTWTSHNAIDKGRDTIAKELYAPKENITTVFRKNTMTCSFVNQLLTQTDIQMLDKYGKMSFVDIDGGAWKQGWNIKYDPLQYNEYHKLRVFVVPHSHNDPGWLKTFDEYYNYETKYILSNALRHLKENPDMTFIWAEISYFSHFFMDIGRKYKTDIQKLVKNGQLEFVTGGWVMPDEANSHWQSILMQLTEGQSWLKKYFDVTPVSSWSIDPFGHSPTLPYILKRSGFKNLLIQRTHYAVKKELALNKELEFYWRQLWDTAGYTDLFTHMMPFYSYDIPHSCGPDPKICCQFDFKRVPAFGLSCPWHVSPQTITDQNVAERAELLVDQWKKKAELYKTNALLYPLGDDFRYSQSTEWKAQYVNYEALFQHINNEPKYHIHAKFATLQEYFDAVHNEETERNRYFPTLSGDFFTYADRADNYWSGYYTSRPYHKRMDRVLLHYVHSAEMLHAWVTWPSWMNFDNMLNKARQELSLFQHHDGITGTARNHVVENYAKRMTRALYNCRFVMQHAVYQLLTKQTSHKGDPKVQYFLLDDSRWPGTNNSRTTIILGNQLPIKHLVFHNVLAQWREDIVDFYISTPYVKVVDFNDKLIESQISLVWSWHKHTFTKTVTPQASTTKYKLIFKVRVPPLGLSTYLIKLTESSDKPESYVSFASTLIMSNNPITIQLGDFLKEVKFTDYKEISLKCGTGDGPTVAFTTEGTMKSMQLHNNEPHIPTKVDFITYGTHVYGDRSGAYLFMPNHSAISINLSANGPPVILITQGNLECSVSVGLPFGVHHTILRDDEFPEIQNLIDINDMDDIEIAMRIQTRIRNDDTFYTDLNGLQMIKRRKFAKLPIQGNYYPIPSAIYIEDKSMRLTIVTAQPLGGSSLTTGEIEIMQDRRLKRDDARGLGQGVMDNQPVLHIFRFILEKITNCDKIIENQAAGALTINAYKASNTLLNPLDKFIYAENDWIGALPEFGNNHMSLNDDIQVAVMRTLDPYLVKQVLNQKRSVLSIVNTGLIIHRANVLQCNGFSSTQNLKFSLQNLLQWSPKNVIYIPKTTLTFLHKLNNSAINLEDSISLCPMDTMALIIQRLR